VPKDACAPDTPLPLARRVRPQVPSSPAKLGGWTVQGCHRSAPSTPARSLTRRSLWTPDRHPPARAHVRLRLRARAGSAYSTQSGGRPLSRPAPLGRLLRPVVVWRSIRQSARFAPRRRRHTPFRVSGASFGRAPDEPHVRSGYGDELGPLPVATRPGAESRGSSSALRDRFSGLLPDVPVPLVPTHPSVESCHRTVFPTLWEVPSREVVVNDFDVPAFRVVRTVEVSPVDAVGAGSSDHIVFQQVT